MKKRRPGNGTGQRKKLFAPAMKRVRNQAKGKLVSKDPVRSPDQPGGAQSVSTSSRRTKQLLQKIQVQQVELERKNEELCRARQDVADAGSNYRDLYESVSIACYSLDAQGAILDLNQAGATLLRSASHHLLGRRFPLFLHESDRLPFMKFLRKSLKQFDREICSVRLSDNETMSWVLVGTGCTLGERKKAVLRLAVMDVTGFIRMQGALQKSNEALEATVKERTAQLTDSLAELNLQIADRRRVEKQLYLVNESLEQRVKERTTALANANERWEWVVQATHDGVWDWDIARDAMYCSPRWKEMHGFQDGDLLESSKEWSSRLHSEDRARVLERLDEYLAGRTQEFWEEYRIQRKDGASICVLDRGVAVRDEQGRAVRMVGAETDISWQKETELVLRRREQEFRALADNVPALFSYVDRDCRYRFVNKRYEELFGRSVGEMVGMTMADLLGADGFALVEPYLNQALRGESVSFEYELNVSGDRGIYLSAQYVPDRDEQGHVRGLFVLLADVTALKLSEGVLRERESQLRALSAQLLGVQEEERRRIARDLHDDVTQRLAALTLELHGMARYAIDAGCDPLVVSHVKDLGASVEQLTTDVQQLAHHLHPSILEHVGLEAAVREQADEFVKRTGLAVEVITRDVPHPIPLDHATCLYRILQESFQNVLKHAQASHVQVRLLGANQGIGLCVHDDGQGFERKQASGGRTGLGLTSMAERVGALKGTFRVKTKRGDGTEIHAWVPLEGVKGEMEDEKRET